MGLFLLASTPLLALNYQTDSVGKRDLTQELSYQLTWQENLSKGKTPLWLTANRYGLS